MQQAHNYENVLIVDGMSLYADSTFMTLASKASMCA